MLNFKVGKTYKDTYGNDWEFLSYTPKLKYQYLFRNVRNNNKVDFHEQKDNSVTYWEYGKGVKIPFVEEKERDWVVGESYEAYNVISKNIQRLKLQKIAECNGEDTVFFLDQPFWKSEEIALLGGWVVFKNGIPKELKDKLENKESLNNKRKYFQKEQIYKNKKGFEWKFKKRIKTEKGLVALFEDETSDVFSFSLYRLNNIECILTSHDTVAFCADESIRNKDGSKAVRVMQ